MTGIVHHCPKNEADRRLAKGGSSLQGRFTLNLRHKTTVSLNLILKMTRDVSGLYNDNSCREKTKDYEGRGEASTAYRLEVARFVLRSELRLKIMPQ